MRFFLKAHIILYIILTIIVTSIIIAVLQGKTFPMISYTAGTVNLPLGTIGTVPLIIVYIVGQSRTAMQEYISPRLVTRNRSLIYLFILAIIIALNAILIPFGGASSIEFCRNLVIVFSITAILDDILGESFALSITLFYIFLNLYFGSSNGLQLHMWAVLLFDSSAMFPYVFAAISVIIAILILVRDPQDAIRWRGKRNSSET